MKNFCNKVLHSICCYNDVSDIDNENTIINHDNSNLNNANPNSLNNHHLTTHSIRFLHSPISISESSNVSSTNIFLHTPRFVFNIEQTTIQPDLRDIFRVR